MGANSFNHGRDLAFGEPEALQDSGHLAARISHVVPRGQRGWVFRTMADEDPQIVQPGRGIQDVVIVRLTLREPFRELVEPGLVTELVRRLRLGPDVLNDSFSISGLTHGTKVVGSLLISNPRAEAKPHP